MQASTRAPIALLFILTIFIASVVPAERLSDLLGRNDTRVWGTPFDLAPGRTVWEYNLEERLARLGYRRVRSRPESAGQFFWGHERFWIYRNQHRLNGTEIAPALILLELRKRDGLIRSSAVVPANDLRTQRIAAKARNEARNATAIPWLEPELIFESLDERRAPRASFEFNRLPKHVWQAVLAAEDARFFDHVGVDGRSLARALLTNLKRGEIAQGGSTITQQLIKVRDLSPRRTLTRKASEAVRALALEAEYDKEEILEAYLGQVYLGHIGGLGLYGFGTASRAFFSRPLEQLDLARSALLAAVIQSPNRLAPLRHPAEAKKRRNWVLGRLEKLGWSQPNQVARAQRQPLGLEPESPEARPGRHFQAWLQAELNERAPRWSQRGRGAVLETSFDPLIQAHGEKVVADGLRRLRNSHPHLDAAPIQAAMAMIDAESGEVVAHIGSDPAHNDAFDRARKARRQPGSTIKPLVLLEAFERCGRRAPLSPATLVADEPLTIDLPSGPWSPQNIDGTFRGVVDIRSALRDSLNIPHVRIARWCGWRPTAARLRSVGLNLDRSPPPSFSLGAVELTPVELAAAYSALAGLGRVVDIRPVRRISRPGGRVLDRVPRSSRRVASRESAFLVRDLLREAVLEGTGQKASIDGETVIAKTGTTNDLRDAWLAGYANGLVAVIWIGLDDGRPLGLTGSVAAAPIWREVMAFAARNRPREIITRPAGIRELAVDPATGLLVRDGHPGSRRELFRERALPRRDRFWRRDPAMPIIR